MTILYFRVSIRRTQNLRSDRVRNIGTHSSILTLSILSEEVVARDADVSRIDFLAESRVRYNSNCTQFSMYQLNGIVFLQTSSIDNITPE